MSVLILAHLDPIRCHAVAMTTFNSLFGHVVFFRTNVNNIPSNIFPWESLVAQSTLADWNLICTMGEADKPGDHKRTEGQPHPDLVVLPHNPQHKKKKKN